MPALLQRHYRRLGLTVYAEPQFPWELTLSLCSQSLLRPVCAASVSETSGFRRALELYRPSTFPLL